MSSKLNSSWQHSTLDGNALKLGKKCGQKQTVKTHRQRWMLFFSWERNCQKGESEGSIKHTRDEYSSLQTQTWISTWRPLFILKVQAENSPNPHVVRAGFRAKLHLRPVFHFWWIHSEKRESWYCWTLSYVHFFFCGEACREEEKKNSIECYSLVSVFSSQQDSV